MPREAVLHAQMESSLEKFPINIPNKATEETFRKTDRNEEVTTYSSFEEMLKDLKLKRKNAVTFERTGSHNDLFKNG